MFFILNMISNTAIFDEFKKHPTEGSSEMANKIKSPKKKTERKSRVVKLFIIIKLQKHLVIVHNDKFWELVSLMLQNLCI
jgi:hypothetical protein